MDCGNTVVIACAMLRDEIEHAMDQTNKHFEIVWIDKGLHEYPQRLHDELQKKIDQNQNKAFILLAFCLCGNAVLGLKSGKAAMMIPRFDDCIHMMMAHGPGKKPEIDVGSLYYTRGWLDSERFIWRDYESYIKKYGQKKADFIIKTMLANYSGLKLIDTGAYEVAGCMGLAKDTAKQLGLAFELACGTDRILHGLLEGKNEGEYVMIKPGETVQSCHFGY